MKKVFLVLLLLVPVCMLAEDTIDRLFRPHELRIGYGDPLYETMVWHESPTYFTLEKTINYRYTGHIFAEYQYRQNQWFSYGGKLDYQQVFWEKELPGDDQYIYSKCNFVDVSLIPTVRFTFFWSEWVNLYCGLGVGMLINGGTEKDYKGRKVAVAPVIDLSLLGVSVGKGMFFGTFEIGGLISHVSKEEIYMVGSRMMAASFGIRF